MEKSIEIKYQVFENHTYLSGIEQEGMALAAQAAKKAYAPYSNFMVGCAIFTKDGNFYLGNNQENASYPVGICAERVALGKLKSDYPNEIIEKIFIYSPQSAQPLPPCGMCRQTMLEYENQQNESIEIFFGSKDGLVYKVMSASSLLPFKFDEKFLK